MNNFPDEILRERRRNFAKYGVQKKTEKEWFKVVRAHLADMLLYIELKEQGKKVSRGFFRKQMVQLAAAAEDSLENSDAW